MTLVCIAFLWASSASRLIKARLEEGEEEDEYPDEEPEAETLGPVKNCRPFFAPIGGILIGKCKPGEVGERCKLVCSQGYVLYGNEEVVCNPNGRWSSRLGVCLSKLW